MKRVPRKAFVDHCRDLDPETFVAFVAALFRARGRTVRRIGDRRLHMQWDDNDVRVLVAPDRNLPETVDADGVVVRTVDATGLTDDDSLVVFDLAALHEQVCYALEPEAGWELVGEYLGLSRPTVTDSHSGADGATEDRQDESANEGKDNGVDSIRTQWQRRPLTLAAVGLGVALVGVVFIVLVGPGIPDSKVTAPATAPSEPTPTPDQPQTPGPSAGKADTSMVTVFDEGSLTRRTGQTGEKSGEDGSLADNSTLPPGINASGIQSPGRLARAHQDSLANASYTLSVKHEEYLGGRLVGTYSQTLRVENGSRYLLTVSLSGELRTNLLRLGPGEESSTGTAQVVRGSESPIGPSSNVTLDELTGRIQDHLRALLSVRNSTLVSQPSSHQEEYRVVTKEYLLVTEGNVATEGTDERGMVFVSPRGRIQYGHWSYVSADDPEVAVVKTIRLTNVG